MFRNKRQGVELSINTIIIFALAILILLILAFIVIGGFNNWNKGTDCVANNGKCNNVCQGDFPIPSAFSCSDKNQHCCTAIP